MGAGRGEFSFSWVYSTRHMIKKGSELVSSSISGTRLVIVGGQNSLSKTQIGLWHFLALQTTNSTVSYAGWGLEPLGNMQALLRKPAQPPFLTSADAPSIPEFFQFSQANLLFPTSRSLYNCFLAERPSLPWKFIPYSSLSPSPHHGRSWAHKTPFLFLPGHMVTLLFPASLAVIQFYMNKLCPVICGQKWCMTSLIPKIFPWDTLYSLSSRASDSEALEDGPGSLNKYVELSIQLTPASNPS